MTLGVCDEEDGMVSGVKCSEESLGSEWRHPYRRVNNALIPRVVVDIYCDAAQG